MSQRRKAPAPDRLDGTSGGVGLLERPLTARSLIASLLLGMHPPRLSSARLVRWCGLFGVSEGTARVALSRMVERGELRADDGVYELAGAVRRRQEAQDWVLDPHPLAWDGAWHLAVVTAEERPAADRAAFRRAAALARLGEVREGLWARPANLPRAAAPAEAWAVVDRQCTWWTGASPGDGQALAERLFAPATWASWARMLAERLDAVTRALQTTADGEASEHLLLGFVVGAAALQQLRRDPLLPEGLLPDGWPAAALRACYRRYQAVYPHAAAAFLR